MKAEVKRKNEEAHNHFNLPEGWSSATLEDIGPIVSGGTPKTKESDNFDGDVPWITPADLTGYEGRTISSGRRNITEKGLQTSSARLIPPRSVLFSSRAPIGYVAIAGNELATNQGFKSVVVSSECDEEFVYFYLKSAKALAESLASGTTFKELSGSRFAKLPIPIAPVSEQHRIVEKIDTLFARLDKGEAALREVQKSLQRYRQSVLKAAVTGELTRDWRARHAGQLEHGRDLLERILASRRAHWQGRGQYKEPAAPDTTDLPDLPEGWVWATTEQLSSPRKHSLCIGPFGSDLKVSDYREEGVPLIFVRNIRSKKFDGLMPKFVTNEKSEKLAAHTVFAGDLLITKMGDPPGDACIYPADRPPAVITADCIKLNIADEGVFHEYLEQAINSRLVQAQIQSISKGVAQQKVTLANFKKIAVPLPPLDEQKMAVELLSEVFQRAAVVAGTCQTELARSQSLRQSILKEAFAGRLVPQDPNDEPASELLARIRAEREAAPPKRRRKAKAKS